MIGGVSNLARFEGLFPAPLIFALLAGAALAEEGGAFSAPQKLSEEFNESDAIGGPDISDDGLTLYFKARRPEGFGNTDLYRATRPRTVGDDGKPFPFGDITNLGAEVNSPFLDGSVHVSADDLTLYFNSMRPGGMGSCDMYMATRSRARDDDGRPLPFGGVVHLGSELNSTELDGSQSVTGDDLTLVFTSARAGGFGVRDLYLATRSQARDDAGEVVPFRGVVNAGEPVNSEALEGGVTISRNGLALIFQSERAGSRDLYMATRPRVLTPSGEQEPFACVVPLSELNREFVEDGPSISSAWPAPGAELYFSTRYPEDDNRNVLRRATWEPRRPFFLRGDCDQDGAVSGLVADAVFLLDFTFLGQGTPRCLAACDANADGVVRGEVSDAVYLLRFNFLGGPPPPAPHPSCGLSSAKSDAALTCGPAPASCP